nr:serpin-ZX [Agapanthus praecox subsp. orientalis]
MAAISKPSTTPVDATYAFRLLADQVGPTFGPTTPACNVSFCPLSLHIAASILTVASSVSTAADASSRHELLLSFLRSNRFPPLPDPDASTAIRAATASKRDEDGGPFVFFDNALWLDDHLARSGCGGAFFQETGRYRSLIHHADFETEADKARSEVESWLLEINHSHAPKLLQKRSVNSNTECIVSNVLLFRGDWAKDLELKLDPSKEQGCLEFYRLNDSSIGVPFMVSRRPQCIDTYPGFKALRLPYERGSGKRHFAMYIFLPDARDGLFDLLDKFATEPGFLDRHLPKKMVPVGEFKVPVRSATYFSQALGIVWPPRDITRGEDATVADPTRDPFQPRCFSLLLFLSEDENGTEAAAASAAVLGSFELVDCDPIDFVADHAFLYVIREDVTGTVLMIGHVNNPVCGDPKFFQTCHGEMSSARKEAISNFLAEASLEEIENLVIS